MQAFTASAIQLTQVQASLSKSTSKSPSFGRAWVWVLAAAHLALAPRLEAALGGPPVYLLPMACSELLPDTDPFVRYLDSVARGNLATEPALSKRIFRLLALREKVSESLRKATERNPVDVFVQKRCAFTANRKSRSKPFLTTTPIFWRSLERVLTTSRNR